MDESAIKYICLGFLIGIYICFIFCLCHVCRKYTDEENPEYEEIIP